MKKVAEAERLGGVEGRPNSQHQSESEDEKSTNTTAAIEGRINT
jgi:hypothetical protein